MNRFSIFRILDISAVPWNPWHPKNPLHNAVFDFSFIEFNVSVLLSLTQKTWKDRNSWFFFGCPLCISGFSWEKTAVKSSHAVIKIVSFMECWGGPALGGNQLCCRKDLRSWGYVWCPQLCCWGWFPLTIFWRGWGWEVEGIVATYASLLGDSFATFIIWVHTSDFSKGRWFITPHAWNECIWYYTDIATTVSVGSVPCTRLISTFGSLAPAISVVTCGDMVML